MLIEAKTSGECTFDTITKSSQFLQHKNKVHLNRNHFKLTELFHKLILQIGEDPTRECVNGTPARAAKSLKFLTSGYSCTLEDEVNNALFSCQSNEMVIAQDIELFSMCEHHLLPFIGKCHVGYIPQRMVISLSKIARIVDMFARRLQIQERLTNDIACALEKALSAQGIIVMIEAMHLCMKLRRVQKKSSITKTMVTTGIFKDEHALKQEFFNITTTTKNHHNNDNLIDF